jgi:CheY-like chemotaxis protein
LREVFKELLESIALTGYGGKGARASAERAGFDLHLTKPINVATLPDVLALALARE